jgi:hypothetical protein
MFDCIEFNEAMRWIDVMSDVAFLVMDLEDQGRRQFAGRFLSAYLEHTGDYLGVGVLPFYLAYRAMVRAKVTALLAAQLESERATRALSTARTYVSLAHTYAHRRRGAIVITRGLSGSGKSRLAQKVVDEGGAIRIRTDVERKRLYNLGTDERSGSGIDSGLYTAEATDRVYTRVAEQARAVASAGYVAVVDGAFLKRSQRDRFRRLAADLEVPFAIVAVHADAATLERRVETRSQRGLDVSEADRTVLEHQRATEETLTSDEEPFAVGYESATGADPSSVVHDLMERLQGDTRATGRASDAARRGDSSRPR